MAWSSESIIRHRLNTWISSFGCDTLTHEQYPRKGHCNTRKLHIRELATYRASEDSNWTLGKCALKSQLCFWYTFYLFVCMPSCPSLFFIFISPSRHLSPPVLYTPISPLLPSLKSLPLFSSLIHSSPVSSCLLLLFAWVRILPWPQVSS